MSDSHASGRRPVPRYFLAGVFVLIPVWITCLVVAFVFRLLSAAGEPAAKWVAGILGERFPTLDAILTNGVFQATLSFLLAIVLIYLLGLFTSLVVGRRLVSFFESLLGRVPLVRSVYGSVKKLTTVLQEKPGDEVQRVVLIDFPSPEMKTVGLVTRVLEDERTGRKLATVYVPTTPNPTSGYLEIVPVDRLTPTDWNMDEAINFVVSGGAVAPDRIPYGRDGGEGFGEGVGLERDEQPEGTEKSEQE